MRDEYLNSRGHELCDSVPFEPSFKVKKPFDMVAYVRAEMERERLEMESEIRSEDDLIEDQLDFDGEYFTDGKMPSSPYEIGNEVPDYAPQKDVSQPDKVSNVSENAPSDAPEA